MGLAKEIMVVGVQSHIVEHGGQTTGTGPREIQLHPRAPWPSQESSGI